MSSTGRAWRRAASTPQHASPLLHSGPAYRYTLSLEPNDRNWIFVLDWPYESNAERGVLTSDYMLVRPMRISQLLDVVATSYGQVQASEPLSRGMRVRDTHLPRDRTLVRFNWRRRCGRRTPMTATTSMPCWTCSIGSRSTTP